MNLTDDTHTTVFRDPRRGAWFAVMLMHHKGRATTSGGLGKPPAGSGFLLSRGVRHA
ncbi:MAG: hypothetical protein HOJ67_12375 [Rhodospirillaceae bacterium]|nr:hypothetical protein [Rhodospirillaceae bacterium]MBT5035640.1 hypothetical protein [Rhodospirillaceae bacterium]MBT6219376.1 hypothetical protein [Rhodospirillaceae bacterium]MBT6362988.1 hypothetical protein [Rhodospirillaceae bacterium]MBT7487772.1 hypothetical protein [Rhodospirillales bacterium]